MSDAEVGRIIGNGWVTHSRTAETAGGLLTHQRTRNSSAVIPRPVKTRTRAGTIEHTDQGVGPALLAVHGGMGGYDQSWLLARALLDDIDAFRVVAVSRPGYLGTPIEVGHTPEQQADAFAALLDELHIERAIVAGNSAGGLAAIQFALRHPQRCARLVLVSAVTGPLDISPGLLFQLKLGRILAHIPGAPEFLGYEVMTHPLVAARRLISDPELASRTLEDPQSGPLLEALQASVFTHTAARMPGIANDVTALQDPDPLPLGEIRVPTLIMHGTSDTNVPVEHGEMAARLIAGARFVALEGGEHFALFSHLHQLRENFEAFIAATSESADDDALVQA